MTFDYRQLPSPEPLTMKYTDHSHIRRQVRLAGLTRFGVGGYADFFFEPQESAELAEFITTVEPGRPITVIGAGSNLLVRDGGIRGVVIRLPEAFSHISVEGDLIRAGAAAMQADVARAARKAGVIGFEPMIGIPGTVGGGIAMNAGASGIEMADRLVEALAISHKGEFMRLSPRHMGMAYRSNDLRGQVTFLEATLRGTAGDSAAIAEHIKTLQQQRKVSQPIGKRTGGSTFRNLPDLSAWKAIEAAGCRGLQIGGACMSEMHCNFMINTGAATAHDLESLGLEVQCRVLEHSGRMLTWEIERVGMEATHQRLKKR